jgi:hypothetical protein
MNTDLRRILDWIEKVPGTGRAQVELTFENNPISLFH